MPRQEEVAELVSESKALAGRVVGPFDQDQWLRAAAVEAKHQAIAAAWDRVVLDVCEFLGEAQDVDRRPKPVLADNGLREGLLAIQR
jgi:hypothetical protein